jgi:hypothetical protein
MAHGVHGERAQVGLDAGPSAGIGAGDGEHHLHAVAPVGGESGAEAARRKRSWKLMNMR